MSDFSSVDTRRAMSRGVYVLVVHDPSIDAQATCDALEALFIVREATTAFDALERLSGAPLACVVCVVGGAIKGTDFLSLVARAAPDQTARLVFLDDGDGDAGFVQGTGASWLPAGAPPSEILAVVSAVSSRR